MTRRSLPCAVYRHFDADGRLLYVGASHDPHARFTGHKATASWAFDVARIDLEWHPDEAAALAAEVQAIRRERPPHNTVHNFAPEGYGHIFLRAYLDRFGVSETTFASRIRAEGKRMRAILDGTLAVGAPFSGLIAAASDGYVPSDCWRRGLKARPYAPVSDQQAREEMERIRAAERFRKESSAFTSARGAA